MGGNLWRKWLGESDEPGRNRVQAFVRVVWQRAKGSAVILS